MGSLASLIRLYIGKKFHYVFLMSFPLNLAQCLVSNEIQFFVTKEFVIAYLLQFGVFTEFRIQ